MLAEQHKKLSMQIIDLLPDDPRDAVAAMAIAYACVVVSTKCPDKNAIDALRVALRQMHGAGTGRLDG